LPVYAQPQASAGAAGNLLRQNNPAPPEGCGCKSLHWVREFFAHDAAHPDLTKKSPLRGWLTMASNCKPLLAELESQAGPEVGLGKVNGPTQVRICFDAPEFHWSEWQETFLILSDGASKNGPLLFLIGPDDKRDKKTAFA
jgi:hypothetical protein